MKIKEILSWLDEEGYNYLFVGDKHIEIDGFSSLQAYHKGCITWIKQKDNYDKFDNKEEITLAVVQSGIDTNISNQIISSNSKEVFFSILHRFWGKEKRKGFVGEGTYISPLADVDPSVYIGYNCTVEKNVKIGSGTIIENNVSLSNATIGNDCIIHSGASIGSDGFGYAFDDHGMPIKIEHFGGVFIGDRAEIGCNACVDRGTIDNTFIGNDVKIDNLVHIAHNVIIERGSMVVAGALICGSAKLKEESYVAPGGIVKNQLCIGENAFIGLGAVVTDSVNESTVVAGIPAKKIRKIKEGDK